MKKVGEKMVGSRGDMRGDMRGEGTAGGALQVGSAGPCHHRPRSLKSVGSGAATAW